MLQLFDIHGLECLIEGLPELVSFIVEGVIECTLFDEAFDGTLVFVSFYFDVLHAMFLLLSNRIILYAL